METLSIKLLFIFLFKPLPLSLRLQRSEANATCYITEINVRDLAVPCFRCTLSGLTTPPFHKINFENSTAKKITVTGSCVLLTNLFIYVINVLPSNFFPTCTHTGNGTEICY